MYTVYKIIYTPANLIIYIGSTSKPLNIRFSQHCSNKTTKVSKTINAYGKENFIIEPIIDNIEEKEEAIWLESYYTEEYLKNYPLQNVNIGDKQSEETKNKISKTLKNRKMIYSITDNKIFSNIKAVCDYYKISRNTFQKIIDYKTLSILRFKYVDEGFSIK